MLYFAVAKVCKSPILTNRGFSQENLFLRIAEGTRELDATDLEELTECLKYAARRHVSSSCFDFLVSVLTAYDGAISTEVASSILLSLSNCKESNNSHRTLLLRILDIVGASANELSPFMAQLLLSKVLHKVADGEYLNHEIFMEGCINKIIESDIHWKKLLSINATVSRVNYWSPSISKKLCERIEEQQEEFIEDSVGSLIGFLHILAQFSNMKPKNWNQIEKIIIRGLTKHIDNDALPWQRIASYFISLNSWPHTILAKATSQKSIKEFLHHEKSETAHKMVVELHQAFELLHPHDSLKMSLSADFWTKITNFVVSDFEANINPQPPLLPALSKGLGGSEFVHNHVVTQYYHYIDHVVVMRKGGFAVTADVQSSSSNSKLTHLQDIAVPSGSLTIGVLPVSQTECSYNGCILRGHIALKIRTLEAMGIAVVPIFLAKWHALAEHEKIPYLMQQLRNKTENHQAMALL